MSHFFIIFGAQYVWFFSVIIAGVYGACQPKVIQKKMIVFAAGTLPGVYVIAKIVSYFYYNPRPFVIDSTVALIAHIPDNGFPSDHTLICAALAAIVYPFNKKISVLLWILTLMVGLSRVLAGVHHLIDVVGSISIAMLGAASVHFIILHASREKLSKKNIHNEATGKENKL